MWYAFTGKKYLYIDSTLSIYIYIKIVLYIYNVYIFFEWEVPDSKYSKNLVVTNIHRVNSLFEQIYLVCSVKIIYINIDIRYNNF